MVHTERVSDQVLQSKLVVVSREGSIIPKQTLHFPSFLGHKFKGMGRGRPPPSWLLHRNRAQRPAGLRRGWDATAWNLKFAVQMVVAENLRGGSTAFSRSARRACHSAVKKLGGSSFSRCCAMSAQQGPVSFKTEHPVSPGV